jgi:hypothetical protein
MKKLLLFVFSLFLSYSFAIAQDGINYQGAATDGNGDELTNQNITIRASVLSTSASGNLQWEETHSTTTDQFGLFNVVIGQGTNTTNGATALFDDMDWGSGNHYLKIEMDATGGTNYAMIGTTQMMSVPYALYAKSAGIDSTMLANMIGSSGGGMGGGCDLRSPDPINNITPVVLSLLSSYTVPNGKNLYLSVWTDITVNSSSLAINASQSVDNFLSPIFGSGDSIQCTSGGTTFGYLVDSSVEPIFISTSVYPSAAFVIPQNKIFVLLGSYGGCYINSFNNTVPNNMKNPIVVLAGDSIHRDGYSYQYGYLVDENYFANCGGGGSSGSASAVDSAMVAGMIANAGGGGSFGERIPVNIDCNNNTQGNPTNEYYATEDGFITGQVYLYSNNANVRIFVDSLSANSTLRGYFQNGSDVNGAFYQSFNIPIKKGDYYYCTRSGNVGINNAVFMKLESGGGGSSTASTGLDSATVATMIANAVSNSSSIGIGDYYGGGVVGYIFQPGDADYIPGETHGYTLYFDNTGIEWGCNGVTTNVVNNNFGQGPNNTQTLAGLCPESNFAAKWCNDLVIGPHNDWFLPTYQEAILIDLSFYLNLQNSFNNSSFQIWLSEEFAPNPNPYNYNCPSCSSASNAWTLRIISNTLDVGATLKVNNQAGNVIAFRKF